MIDCIFCKIISKEMKSDMIYEDERIAIFKDINPQAPVHHLIVPKKHISSISECTEEDKGIIGELFLKAKELAEKEPNLAGGYRLIINNGKDAGQAVFHLHIHLLGGRRMAWPPS
ncbi:MAG: histidine triad nucleotide-binding protein [Bacteroidales bacterium]|nr:histidine triad nucleotide-binding protein [Bacteroidales bacterium]